MKNSEAPAMPYMCEFAHDKGLTKREHFACLAMQGIVSSDTRRIYGSERVAIDAVSYADALLKELEK